MAEFSRYLCWDPVEASTLISTEAVSPSISVFFATHAPLRIFRAHVQAGHATDTGTPVDEHAVRHDFLTRPAANGVLFMPVIGDSGTGKSHLVRWIKECTPSDEKRRVIYLPKLGTSLKSVVTALLDDAPGEDFDALRVQVAEVTEQRDAAGLQNRLLNNLQEAILAAEPPSGMARILVAPTGLPALLLDPHVRAHLLEPHRLVPQLVAKLLSDREDGEPERPPRFTIDDLPTTIDDPGQASAQARHLLGIIKHRPELQQAAVDLLNANLDAAVLSATVGIGRLQRAMLDIRRLYAEQRKEIILLIEDFALVQGLQRDLLDAIIEVGYRDGVATLAPIRTLMAVTPGYFAQLADTVQTRARAASPHMYDLDNQFDNTDAGVKRVLAFVGRYLNAARLGRERLDSLAIRTGKGIPNVCDECPMADSCHAGFGVTEEGHGLYPFNRTALVRAIHSTALPEKPDAIVPRAILGAVVRNVLQAHANSLGEGTFPDERFREDYPTARAETALSSAVQHLIDETDRVDAARRKVVLEFWGNAPADLVNLAPEIHTGFALPQLTLDTTATVVGPDTVAEAVPKAEKRSDLSLSQLRSVQRIEEWQTRSVNLHQATANELRGLVSDAVLRRCDWTDPIGAEPSAAELREAWPANSTTVSITGADAENLPGTPHAPIKFARTPANAQFLIGLIAISAGRIAGNGAHMRRLYALADERAPTLKQRIRGLREFTDPQLVLGLRAALIGALLGGRAYPGQPQASLVNAVFDDGDGWQLDDRATRTPGWLDALAAHLEARRDLTVALRRAFGYGQGATIRMIDIAHVLPLLREASEAWTWTPSGVVPVPKWARPAVRGFNRLPVLVSEQMTLLQNQLFMLRRLLPPGIRGRDMVKAVTEAHNAGFIIGEVPSDGGDFTRMLGTAAEIDWNSIDRLEQQIMKWYGTPDGPTKSDYSLAIVGQDHGRALADATLFLQRTDQWLTTALDSVASRAGAAFSDAREEIQGVVDEWTKIRSQNQ
ncbi:protein DpdH [Actinoplanes sp. NPDC051513]|uniref:protein DpdH n=1 Tax=Actinoplanes sp. NPDC051513 TaxID=3363908 RepID=UPI0037A29A26